MFPKFSKTLITLSLLLGATSASATPLNDYNLILSGDLAVSGGSGHIEGKAFIGGNLTNGSIFAQRISKNSTDDTVKVVGNVNANHGMHVEAGYIAYGGTTNVTNTNNWNGICNGNGVNKKAACFKQVTDGSLAAERNVLLEELAYESAYFKGLSTSNGFTLTGDSNNKTFKYAGAATELAVFNIAAKDLSNINWGVNFGAAVNVLINVTGTSFNAGNAHVNGFQTSAGKVLWNFADATNITFGDSWYGSILALNATINTRSNLNGAIAAKSYIGNGEIHDYRWSYVPPKPPVKVSEPSALLLSVMGLLFLGLLRRRNRVAE